MAEHGGKEPDAESGGESAARPDTSGAAVAVALGRTTHSSEINAKAAAFLEKQARLVDLQMEHLHEERELQHRHGRLKFFSERLKVGLQLLTMVVGLAIAIGAGVMVWSAAHARGLVIEAFTVPPDLAARGITGKVVASKLLDDLTTMQNSVQSARAASTYANNWTTDIKVEIPETGVSIGDLQRMLVQWLGHQTVIDGEIYRTSTTGLTVAARVGAIPARGHAGPEANLDALIQTAAENVFEDTQPYRYAVWLRNPDVNRQDESRVVYARLATDGPLAERPWATLGMSRSAANETARLDLINQALRLDPNLTVAWENRGSAQDDLGLQEQRLGSYSRALETLGRRDHGGVSEVAARGEILSDRAILASITGDYRAAITEISRAPTLPNDINGLRTSAPMFQAGYLARSHDPGAARALLGPGQDDGALMGLLRGVFNVQPNTYVRQAEGDWAGVLQQLAGVEAAWPNLTVARGLSSAVNSAPVLFWPGKAEALAHMGRMDEAKALIGQTPLDCYGCVRVRAAIAVLAGDSAGADHWYAEAARQGPSLPFAEAEWAQALLARGDAAGAIAKATAANRKGPHFADPLEVWGEALLKQGDAKGAAAKFAEADKYAPRWGRNHLLWGEALAKQGKTAEARAQFTAAAGLDLTAADKADLARAMTPVRG